MWFDKLDAGKKWSSLWYGLVLCSCGGIRRFDKCSVCEMQFDSTPVRIEVSPRYFEHIPPSLMGGEGRYEDWLYLDLIEREWKRPRQDVSVANAGIADHSMADRASIVLLFWTYFESRIERIIRLGLKTVPAALREDGMMRYASVGARMDRLYQLIYGTTYHKDLEHVGAAEVATLLREVQRCRNDFTHGNPAAITDDLVERIVAALYEEHHAWIRVFNVRIAGLRPQ